MKPRFTSRARWRAKLEKAPETEVVDRLPKMAHLGSGAMLIPSPQLSAGFELRLHKF